MLCIMIFRIVTQTLNEDGLQLRGLFAACFDSSKFV